MLYARESDRFARAINQEREEAKQVIGVEWGGTACLTRLV